MSNAEIETLLAARLGKEADRYGIVVGVVDASGRRFVSAGRWTRGDARTLGGDTLFEIGSITSIKTAWTGARGVSNEMTWRRAICGRS